MSFYIDIITNNNIIWYFTFRWLYKLFCTYLFKQIRILSSLSFVYYLYIILNVYITLRQLNQNFLYYVCGIILYLIRSINIRFCYVSLYTSLVICALEMITKPICKKKKKTVPYLELKIINYLLCISGMQAN